MKTFKYKYFRYLLFSLLTGLSFTSCEEDELEKAPRLFRPVTALDNQSNKLTASWNNIKGATTYDLELYKATGTDDAGNPIFDLYRTTTVNTSPYTFDNLEWDEKYKLKIKATGSDIESKFYETDDISIVYISKIKELRTIDIAALALWEVDNDPITLLRVIPQNGGDAIDIAVSQPDFESGKKEIPELQPETAYKVCAYSGDEPTGDTYKGRYLFTTKKSENFDEIYGEGKYLDIRNETGDPSILSSTDIKNAMNSTEGLAIILKGGYQYNVSNSIVFGKSVTFATGLTLEGNAVFVQSGGFVCASGTSIDHVTFKSIDFISDKAMAKPVKDQTNKDFEGRQVYSVNGTNTTINNMTFENCRIEGYRAIIRLQGATDGVRNILFNGCTINGIGDQAIVTTNNQLATMDNITFKNSTLTNIVMLCDLRKSAAAPVMNIIDCTFCYAPMETTANANTPMFRFNGNNGAVLNITNTIFGPSMASTGSAGSTLITYTPGPKGSIMLDNKNIALGIVNSYKTNFDWTEVSATTYPLTGLEAIAFDETGLFFAPTENNYIIKQNFAGAKTSGATKWRMP